MERAYLESNIVTELEKRIEICEQQKKRLTQFIQNLNNRWFEGKISYEDYQKARNESFDGKTISEWLDTYNNYIKDCKRRIKQQKNKFVAKTFLFFFCLAIASILIFSVFYLQPSFMGFAIKGSVENLSQELNQTGYEEQLEYQEVLNESYSEKQEEVSQKKVSSFQEESPPASEANISEEIEVPESVVDVEEEISENVTKEVEEKLNITEKATEINITNVSIGNITKVDEVDATITTIQHKAVIGEPVRWVKKIKLEKPGTVKVKLPKQAKNIIVNKINPSEERKPANTLITGAAILENRERSSILTSIINFFKNIFSTITGRAIIETTQDEQTEITIEDDSTEYEIEYETPAPQAFEEKTKTGKKITISGPDTLHYEDVLAYTELTQEVPEQKIRLYRITEGIKEQTEFIPYDKNENGLIDYIEWTIPHLSNQTYELEINITDAEHLNKKREFIANIHNYVNETDNITYTIPKNEYVRAYFESNLTNENVIDIVVKNSKPATIEVYEKDSDIIIGKVENVLEGVYYIHLNHSGSQSIFDMKSIDSEVVYDYIHDETQTNPINPTFASNCENWTYSEVDADTFASGACDTESYKLVVDDPTDKAPPQDKTDYLRATSDGFTAPTDTITAVDANFTYQTTLAGSITTGWKVRYKILDGSDVLVTTCYEDLSFQTSGVSWTTKTCSPSAGLFTEGATYKVQCELETSNTVKQDIFTISMWCDDAYLTFTHDAPDNPPYWSINQSSIAPTYSPSTLSYFNITWQDDIDVSTVWFESNYSGSADNYSMNEIVTDVYNYSAILPAGSHYWKSYANDSAGEWNQTDDWTFDIAKNSSSCNVVFNESTGQDYGIVFKVWSNCTTDDFTLYRNETIIENNSDQDLGAGTWNFTVVRTDDSNYSNVYDEQEFVINQVTSTCTLDVSSSPVVYETQTMANCSCTNLEDSVALYRNETNVTLSENGTLVELGAGNWYYVCNVSATQNYSSATDDDWINVTKAGNPVTLLLNGNPDNLSIPYPQQLNASASSTAGIVNLFRDSINVTDENSQNVTLAADYYEYFANATGNQNYTDNSTGLTFYANISKAAGVVTLYINHTEANATITAGSSIWLNATLITGDSGNLFLYKNGTQINNDTSPISNDTQFSTEGLYNISAYYEGNENYTADWSLTWWVNVTPSANDPPANPTPEINSTDGSNKTLQDLHCFDTILDPDNDTMNVTIRWYKNAALDLTIDYDNSYDNGTFFDETLDSANTSVNDIWKCEMRLYDGQAYSDWVNSSNLTIINTAPQIVYVGNETFTSGVTPNEAPDFTTVTFNITMKDSDGYADLNDSSVQANVTKTGATTRENLSCELLGDYDDYYANYSCSINMWYWDAAGYWDITVYGEDLSSASAVNDSTTFKYNPLTALEISPTLLTWPSISPLSFNETGSDIPTLINNTGNVNLTIQINATHLYGEDDSNYAIYVGNFSAHINFGGDPPAQCDGTTLSNNTFINVTDSVLEPGNLSQGGGAGQEEIYYCIKEVGLISSQIYSTSNAGSWTIGVVALLAAIIIRRKKKKRKIKEDNLVKALGLIVEELKEKYSLNKAETVNFIIKELGEKYKLSKKETLEIIKIKQKENIPITIFSKNLGGLEALCKYMKENLSMSYHEIAEQLARDDRTIWTSYKKAVEKQSEPIKIKETIIFVPISIFKNRKLTVLEAIVMHLKEKGIRYNEIAALVNRNQKNIWTIYSRAVSKLMRKSL